MDESQAVFQVIGSVLLCVAATIATTSVILHARVPWRASVMGRHLMAYMAVMAAVLDMGVIRLIVGADSWWFALLRLVTFMLVPVVMGQRVWLQIKAQRAVRTAESEET